MWTAQAVFQVLQGIILGGTIGKLKAGKPQVDVLPQTVTRLADGIWSVLMYKKYTAMIIAGILCLSVEAATLAPMSFMLTRLWFQYQAISNIKRFLLGCASRNCFLGAFLFISYPYYPHEYSHLPPCGPSPQNLAQTFDGPPTLERSGSEHRRAVTSSRPWGKRGWVRKVEPSLTVRKDG